MRPLTSPFLDLRFRMPTLIRYLTRIKKINSYEQHCFIMFQLPAVAPFSVSSEYTTLGQRWEKWVQSLEFFLAASNITDSSRKRAVLLHLAGPEVQDIFLTLTDTGVAYETALAKLTEYFTPKKNIPLERHLFRQVSQEQGLVWLLKIGKDGLCYKASNTCKIVNVLSRMWTKLYVTK